MMIMYSRCQVKDILANRFAKVIPRGLYKEVEYREES